MDLALLKQHLRVDISEDDALIQGYANAADLLIRRETGKNFVLATDTRVDIAQDALFQQAILMLVAHWYECRQPLSSLSVVEVPFAVTCLTSQIALGGDYFKDDVDEDEASEEETP
jgi:uncharacterized phage protein (predicted DNA packaging)